jgi:thioredoxin 1|tara:strand:- start:437 stop:697 length:261 start_codon:yes stop_codon:yes gene_type:complete
MIKVIKFYADWCGPCKLYAKIFDKVTQELKDSIEVQNINVEKDRTGLAAEYKVTSIPYTVVINNGNIKNEVGLMDEKTLKKFILGE